MTDLDTIRTRDILVAEYLPPAAICARKDPIARSANPSVCPPSTSARYRSCFHDGMLNLDLIFVISEKMRLLSAVAGCRTLNCPRVRSNSALFSTYSRLTGLNKQKAHIS